MNITEMNPSENRIDVLVHIYSITINNEEQQEHTQQVTGHIYQRGNAVNIYYTEEVEDIGLVTSTLQVKEGEVTITRQGAIQMHHVYYLGEKTTSTYQTPYGSLEMEAQTTKLSYQAIVDGKQGQLSLEYDLSIQQQYIGRFLLRLRMHILH